MASSVLKPSLARLEGCESPIDAHPVKPELAGKMPHSVLHRARARPKDLRMQPLTLPVSLNRSEFAWRWLKS